MEICTFASKQVIGHGQIWSFADEVLHLRRLNPILIVGMFLCPMF